MFDNLLNTIMILVFQNGWFKVIFNEHEAYTVTPGNYEVFPSKHTN